MKSPLRYHVFLAAALALPLASCDSGEPAVDPAQEMSISDDTTAEDAAEIKMESPVAASSADPIRGPGGLEEKCLARVKQETGAPATSTNHIEESEAAIEIYVNVEGAQAPWKCLGNKDGSIEEVYFTGSEGAA